MNGRFRTSFTGLKPLVITFFILVLGIVALIITIIVITRQNITIDNTNQPYAPYNISSECIDANADTSTECLQDVFLKIATEQNLDTAIKEFQVLIDGDADAKAKIQYLTARMDAMGELCGMSCSPFILQDAHHAAELANNELERASILCKYVGLYGLPVEANESCNRVQELIEQGAISLPSMKVGGDE